MDEVTSTVVLSCLSSSLLYLAASEKKCNKNVLKKSCWIKEWRRRREDKGIFNFLTKELKTEDASGYKSYLRMDEICFQKILNYVSKDITKKDTKMRKAILADETLGITLRFLATGESFRSLDFQSRVSKSCLANSIIETCEAIYNNMKKDYLKFPETHEQWKEIAKEFEQRWNFPNCIGALDGKHIAFSAPKKDVALYYNYEGFNSIVLLAMSDANCKFIYIDVGCNGRISDGGVFAHSDLMKIVQRSSEFFPLDEPIGNNRIAPFVIVADEAFPLQRHILKPFPFKSTEPSKKIFNGRLSHSRQVIERSFGILSNRFRILLKTINLNAQKTKRVVQCCCVLHNFLIEHSKWYFESANNGSNVTQKRSITTIQNSNPNRHGQIASDVRNTFMDYFNNEGKVSWQEKFLK